MLRILFTTIVLLASWSASAAIDIGKGMTPTFTLGLGTSGLEQKLDTTINNQPLAGYLAGRINWKMVHLGVSVAKLLRYDAAGSGSALDKETDFTLIAVNTGLILGRFMVLDLGYGMGTMKRKETNPSTQLTNSFSASSPGTGWQAGLTLTPLHFGQFALGISYFYFDIKGTSYSATNTVNGVETNSTVSTSISAKGWMSFISLSWSAK